MKLLCSLSALPLLTAVLTPLSAAPPGRSQAIAPRPSSSALVDPQVVLNQAGVPGHWSFEVFVIGPATMRPASRAEVIEVASGEVVARAPVGRSKLDPDTGDTLAVIRVPPLRTAGEYVVRVGDLRSPTFAVGPEVHGSLERLLLRSFYLQRCGHALDDRLTGIHHGACHLGDGKLPNAGASWEASGGWHDAGDYGKYVATTAVSIGRVLHAYEREPARFAFDDLDIPESGNGVPDVLDEMKVGLDWMLKMQRADGAVYRKVGGKEWPKRLLPEDDSQVRYVHGVTSPETAKAAAAWALAARLYRPTHPRDAERYLAAARRAWAWLATQPEQVFDWREGDDSGSGPYRSNEVDREASLLHDRDDRLWAATELAITTGEASWLATATELARQAPVNLYEWKDASLLALSYFVWHPALAKQRELARIIGARLARRAQAPLAQVRRGGYRIANQRFVWGSNKMTAEEGVLMCLAHRLTRRPELLAAARDQLHYLLGRNHFGTSFVSGVGERAVRNVTHIFGEAARVEIPGLFVGGPNEAEQSNIAPRHLGARSWVDDRRSYATNEYAIDYNASLLGLLSVLRNDCAR
ncbi:MAG: glycoside hydrolase family 9 protein [Myxococcales bacterium]|jgi:endoglucanase|nr:glycoside hydrolase family 9 protein [Myxococcales bacterium]